MVNFKEIFHFSRFQRGSNIFQGGGGGPTFSRGGPIAYSLSDFISDFGKLPLSEHLGKYFIKIGKISAKIHEIGKIKAIFGLGMTPI